MNRMKSVLFVLAVLLFPSAALILTDSSEAADETVSEGCLLVSYNTEKGTKFLVKTTQSYCYRYIELYIYGSGIAAVTLDGHELNYSLPGTGVLKITYQWEPSSEHTLSVKVGSSVSNYDLTVRKSISIKDLDDLDEYETYVTLSTTELNNQKIFAALAAFVASAVGLFLAFKLAQWRAANGSESL